MILPGGATPFNPAPVVAATPAVRPKLGLPAAAAK